MRIHHFEWKGEDTLEDVDHCAAGHKRRGHILLQVRMICRASGRELWIWLNFHHRLVELDKLKQLSRKQERKEAVRSFVLDLFEVLPEYFSWQKLKTRTLWWLCLAAARVGSWRSISRLYRSAFDCVYQKFKILQYPLLHWQIQVIIGALVSLVDIISLISIHGKVHKGPLYAKSLGLR